MGCRELYLVEKERVGNISFVRLACAGQNGADIRQVQNNWLKVTERRSK